MLGALLAVVLPGLAASLDPHRVGWAVLAAGTAGLAGVLGADLHRRAGSFLSSTWRASGSPRSGVGVLAVDAVVLAVRLAGISRSSDSPELSPGHRRGTTTIMKMRGAAVAVAVVLAGQTPAAAAGGVQPDPPSWGLDRIDQRAGLDHAYHYASDASGVTIYVIDSGVDAKHPDFEGRVAPGRDFLNGGSDTSDTNGHGTRLAGIAAGKDYGVAKGAQIVPVRVLDKDGGGATDQIIAGHRLGRAERPAARGRRPRHRRGAERPARRGGEAAGRGGADRRARRAARRPTRAGSRRAGCPRR